MSGRKIRSLAIKMELGHKTGGFLAGKIRGKVGFFGGGKRREKGGSFRERIGRKRRSRDFVGSETTRKMRRVLLIMLKGFVGRIG